MRLSENAKVGLGMTKEQQKIIQALCKKYNFSFCGLFGSGVERIKISRDYDLAFHVGHEISSAIKFEILKILQPYFDKPLDVILIQPSTDPLLAYEIALKGKLIYELRTESFLEFQTSAWKEYLDTQRYRDYEKEYIRKKIKNVS